MDGRIAVESKLKEGSVFRVELEFDKAQESSAARTELNGMLPAAQLHQEAAGRPQVPGCGGQSDQCGNHT